LDRSTPVSIAYTHELAVPVFGRHPQFNFDFRIGGWLQSHDYAAMRRYRRRRS
jgi:hypothetical protein